MRRILVVSDDDKQPTKLAGGWRVVKVIDRYVIGGRYVWRLDCQRVPRVASEALAV